ncbi:uncharacterized protein AMSG_00091, partial [Thecamonas trahens ATCC 50062]
MSSMRSELADAWNEWVQANHPEDNASDWVATVSEQFSESTLSAAEAERTDPETWDYVWRTVFASTPVLVPKVELRVRDFLDGLVARPASRSLPEPDQALFSIAHGVVKVSHRVVPAAAGAAFGRPTIASLLDELSNTPDEVLNDVLGVSFAGCVIGDADVCAFAKGALGSNGGVTLFPALVEVDLRNTRVHGYELVIGAQLKSIVLELLCKGIRVVVALTPFASSDSKMFFTDTTALTNDLLALLIFVPQQWLKAGHWKALFPDDNQSRIAIVELAHRSYYLDVVPGPVIGPPVAFNCPAFPMAARGDGLKFVVAFVGCSPALRPAFSRAHSVESCAVLSVDCSISVGPAFYSTTGATAIVFFEGVTNPLVAAATLAFAITHSELVFGTGEVAFAFYDVRRARRASAASDESADGAASSSSASN